MRNVVKNSEDEITEEENEIDNNPLTIWSSEGIVSIVNAIVLGILAVKVGNLSLKYKQFYSNFKVCSLICHLINEMYQSYIRREERPHELAMAKLGAAQNYYSFENDN